MPETRYEEQIPLEVRRGSTIMTNSISAWRVTLAGLVMYWTMFWALFFRNSAPVLSERRYEEIGPLFEVFSRGFGENLAAAAHTPWMMSSFWLNLPCWLITSPLTHLGLSGSFLGTNVSGWRLLLITVLSGVQWYFIASWLQRFVDRRGTASASMPS